MVSSGSLTPPPSRTAVYICGLIDLPVLLGPERAWLRPCLNDLHVLPSPSVPSSPPAGRAFHGRPGQPDIYLQIQTELRRPDLTQLPPSPSGRHTFRGQGALPSEDYAYSRPLFCAADPRVKGSSPRWRPLNSVRPLERVRSRGMASVRQQRCQQDE